jgi:hypothetical protein
VAQQRHTAYFQNKGKIMGGVQAGMSQAPQAPQPMGANQPQMGVRPMQPMMGRGPMQAGAPFQPGQPMGNTQAWRPSGPMQGMPPMFGGNAPMQGGMQFPQMQGLPSTSGFMAQRAAQDQTAQAAQKAQQDVYVDNRS